MEKTKSEPLSVERMHEIAGDHMTGRPSNDYTPEEKDFRDRYASDHADIVKRGNLPYLPAEAPDISKPDVVKPPR